MKRKASILDDEPSSMGEWPTFEYASSTSTASPESVKATADNGQTHAHWNVGTVPYLSSRTRKRHRDGRPDEDTIHQNTLAKLFNAQKQLHNEEHDRDWQMSSPAISPLTSWPPTATPNGSVPHAWDAHMEQPERNQRSIASFFTGAPRKPHTRKSQPALFQFSSVQNATSTMARCQDCSTSLRSINIDSQMMDVDNDTDLQHSEWSCASCSREVCDLCAVRGDYRICLECAMPGGG